MVSPTNSNWISGPMARVGLNMIGIYMGLDVSSDAMFHTKVMDGDQISL